MTPEQTPAEQTIIGGVAIRGSIHVKWLALAMVLSPDGDDVQAHLGPPRAAQRAIAARHGGGAIQLFRRGAIVARRDARAFVVYGALNDGYQAEGGPEGGLGQPIADEEASSHGGRIARFDRGDLYWREDAGLREVRGVARRLYASGRDPFARSRVNRGVALLALVRRAAKRVLAPGVRLKSDP